jgi:hypothetical protein
MKEVTSRVGVLCLVFVAFVAPACEIHLQRGASGEPAPDPTGAGAGGAAGGWTSEELAAFDAIQNADPVEIARVTNMASFAAVSTSNFAGAQVGDPSTLDATPAPNSSRASWSKAGARMGA